MDIIPVIDVADGVVVRAVRGDRAHYKPVESGLVDGNAPPRVANALRALFPFRKLYVADLDGITGKGRNKHLVPMLSAEAPWGEIWVDAGITSRGAVRAVLAPPLTTLVIGSEALESVADYREILAEAGERVVLSLDFQGDEYMGPQALLADAGLWPARVIVMTLARVGSTDGPDLDRIAEVSARAHGRKVYAAGGIRGAADIEAVRRAGATGALMASALHDKKITADDLRKIVGR